MFPWIWSLTIWSAWLAVAALVAVVWTLRGLRKVTPKDRLAGVVMPAIETRPLARRSARIGAAADSTR